MKKIFFISFIFFLGYNLNKYIFYLNKKLFNFKKIDKEVQVKLIKIFVDKNVQTDIDNKKIKELINYEKDLFDINKGIYKWTII